MKSYTVHEQLGPLALKKKKRYQNNATGKNMAKASRLLLLLATLGVFVLAVIMLLNSDSELMAIPLIGVSILAGFGYMMFDAEEPQKPDSTPGALDSALKTHDLETHKEQLPDLAQGEYDVPIL